MSDALAPTLRGGSGSRFVNGGALAAIVSSIALSVLFHGVLPNQVRIHWGSPYVGPEFASKPIVLAAFPVVTVVAFVGLRAVGGVLQAADADGVRRLFDAATVGTLALVVLLQAALLGANLA